MGAMLAIPVGLASAYSIYHTNFTTEARCETLRSNIVSMLDKNADPAALRMLMRRDVMTFEKSCASVDPDAVVAFRKLLVHNKLATRPEPLQAQANVVQSQAQPQPAPAAVRKQAEKSAPMRKPPAAAAETKSAKQEMAKPLLRETDAKGEIKNEPKGESDAKPDAKTAAAGQTASDAEWLEAVRGALVHAPAPKEEAKETAAAHTAAAARPLGELRAPAAGPADAPASISAPALAPAESVLAAPAPADENDHPVPPASIPDGAPQVTAAVPAEKPQRSRIKALIADIPLLGRVVDP
jgi:hypothetical protein